MGRATGRGPQLPIFEATTSGAPAPGSDPHLVRADDAMVDGFGRRIEYLRISVTDKCNLRCVYCMPEEGLPWIPKSELLSWEEIRDVVAAMAPMGLKRVRLTGGEPLVRRDIPTLVRMLRAVPGIEDLSLSTNAVLLDEHADALRDAGLNRVNVSLDSLRDERIDEIARRPGSAAKIWKGLAAAERAGFHPLKINVVLMRGRNDDEIEDFARLTLERPWHVRFIEVIAHGFESRGLAGRAADLRRGARADLGDRSARAGGGPDRQRPGSLLALPRRGRLDRRDHSDEPHLLRPLQPHAADRRRQAPAVPLR